MNKFFFFTRSPKKKTKDETLMSGLEETSVKTLQRFSSSALIVTQRDPEL